jgi:hypothetical protein
VNTYHNIFLSIVQEHRKSIASIAKSIGHTGRGKRRATVSKYVHEMYDEKISFGPNLVLKTHENPLLKAYLCSTKNKSQLGSIFEKLKNDQEIIYVLLGSGNYDFFLTSMSPTLTLESYDLIIHEESILYTPLYTHPHGWNLSFLEASRNVLKTQFKKGLLDRKLNGILDWSNLDMLIFESMRENARKKFTETAEIADVASNTIKNHYYKHVLPNCNIAHYFFPKGYDNYMKNQIRIYSKYEKSLVESFKRLPCTTYVYPFEKGILITLFHENINIVMTLMGKMEERGIIEYYELSTPLWYTHV